MLINENIMKNNMDMDRVLLGQDIQRNYQTFMMRFLGTHGPTDFFCSFFIFDLTHIESRISPNIKILFCWSQRLSCCLITSIPCTLPTDEIYHCPQTFPPQYKRMHEKWQHGEYKIPTYKIWQ